jgi:hypothetical protein
MDTARQNDVDSTGSPDPQHCFLQSYFLQPAGLFVRNHNEVGKVNLELEENLGTRHTALDEIL